MCPSLPLCVYNCRLFSFHYYVMSFAFYQKQNVRAFIIILGMTMKAVAFESQPEINGFVEKLVIFFCDQFLKGFLISPCLFGRTIFHSCPHYIHHGKYILKLDKPEIYTMIPRTRYNRAGFIVNCYGTFCFLCKNLVHLVGPAIQDHQSYCKMQFLDF